MFFETIPFDNSSTRSMAEEGYLKIASPCGVLAIVEEFLLNRL